MINLGEERILDFLDGRLALPDEEELLHTLAVSPERRQVLRAHIRLRELTSNLAKQERFTVPESVTDQLFSRLEQAGFNPPAMPESMVASASHTPFAAPLAGAAGAGVLASAVSSGWRFGMMGLVAASVVSFVLGAGAYYVFGSSLGLRTHSQELAALKHASRHGIAAATQPVSQASIAASPMAFLDNAQAENGSSSVGGTKNSVRNGSTENGSIGPVQLGLAAIPSATTPAQVPSAQNANTASVDNGPSIGLTAPREIAYGLKKDKMEYLNGPASIWPNAIPAPYSIDRGTISFRQGIGPSLSSSGSGNNIAMGKLTEFRIGWTMWNYVIWRASMGEMFSYEHNSSFDPMTGIVKTSENPALVSNTVVGLETGVTLDPLGIPIDALAGFLYSEGSTNSSTFLGNSFIGRVSLMAHFEPWKLMEVSAGLEGLFYDHNLMVRNPNSNFYKNVTQPVKTSEVDGLVGPALEIGWHF